MKELARKLRKALALHLMNPAQWDYVNDILSVSNELDDMATNKVYDGPTLKTYNVVNPRRFVSVSDGD